MPAMNSKKKLAHASFVLNHIKNEFSSGSLDIFDMITLKCCDADTRCTSLLLAAISDFLKEYLDDVDQTSRNEPMIIVPDLKYRDVETFFKYLYTTNVDNIFNLDDLPTLARVCESLQIKSDLIPKNCFLTSVVANESHVVDNVVTVEPEPRLLPEQEKPSCSRFGRPVKMTHKDDEDELAITVKIPTCCKYCDKHFNHIKARNNHMLGEHYELCVSDGIVFPCEECGKKFIGLTGRNRHMKKSHHLISSSSNFLCPFNKCDESSLAAPFSATTLKALKNHVKERHPDKDKSCIGCGADCRTKSDLLKHIQTHTSTRYFYTCLHCGQKFLSAYNLVTHKRDQHSVADTLVCKVCGKNFKNAKFLQHHEAKHKSGEILPPGSKVEYICNEMESKAVCGKIFKSKGNLERHIRSHRRLKTHVCGDCGKYFVDSTRLKEHRWIHAGYKPLKCHHCDKSFRHKNHLRHHEAYAHGETRGFTCSFCNKSFCYNYQLRTHIQTRHKTAGDDLDPEGLIFKLTAPPLKNNMKTLYQCSLCPKLFEMYKELQKHCEDEHDNSIFSLDLTFSNYSVEGGEQNSILLQVSDDKEVPVPAEEAQPEHQQLLVVYDVQRGENGVENCSTLSEHG